MKQKDKIYQNTQALTFDDVLLVPNQSDVMPANANTHTQITQNIHLNIPVISAAMDTVTEAPMAIAMAQNGGIGVIHRNMTPKQQAEHVEKVKKYEAGIVTDPVTIDVNANLEHVLQLKQKHKISGIPVIDQNNKKCPGILVGIITNRDIRFATNPKQPVKELMTKNNLVTVKKNISTEQARKILHQHKIEKLIVVDQKFRCIGLITVTDMEKAAAYPNASKDPQGRLRVAAAVGTDDIKRANMIHEAGGDLIVIDTAHGHSKKVIRDVAKLRKINKNIQIMAGNVATPEAVKELAQNGANAVKVGIGPGSICTTRIIAGVGVPQLSAILNCVKEAQKHNITLIADGGIRNSGDLAKALAAGADCAMIGSLLAGTDESPGDVYLYQGRSYKQYRGMGSIGAMARGSADRYFQKEVREILKLVPEGVEAQVPHKGPVAQVLHQLVGGIRASMGYTGCKTIKDFKQKAQFIRVSNAALKENHPHDVIITRETPNYNT